MAFLTEVEKNEIGTQILSLTKQITSYNDQIVLLGQKLADLKKTVNENELFTEADRKEVSDKIAAI